MIKMVFKMTVALVIFCGFISHKAMAQVDPHFSQYYAYPLWLNPGLTGVMDGSFRATANFKQQWAAIPNPYSTGAISIDGPVSGHLSLGGTILNQSAGDAGFRYVNVLLSAAYSLLLNEEKTNVISVGIQAGGINRRFDPSKLRSGSQWDPIIGYNPGQASGEVYNNANSTGLDANVGLFFYNRDPDMRINPFAGVSLYHLSRPYDSFYKILDNKRLPLRMNVHGGLKIKVNDRFNLTPELLYLHQGNSDEKVATLYAQYRINNVSDFLFGGSYRYKDAAIPFVGFRIKDFTLGLSYDADVSGSGSSSLRNGGLELSLSYIKRPDLKKLHLTCPSL